MKHLVFICILCVNSVFSQDITELQDYLPPSPEAQEFIKYGEYPVSMYTGTPNISIPIYAINSQEIQIPISLSYHAAGIQVDQTATWVGLGWSLNVGGMISKIPRGIPDDEAKGFLISSIPELSALSFNHDFYEDASTGKQDTESDIYYYNFSGYSGKFFFDRNKEIRLIDQAPIDISYSAGKFTIITKEGTTYEFNDIERTQSISFSLGNPTGFGTEKDYVSSWHLSKVISKNQIDTVMFTYEVGSDFSINQYSYSESTGNDIDTSTCPPSVINNVHKGGGSEIASQTQVTQNPKRLKEISFSNGKVEFNRIADRLDVSLDRLTEIIVYKKENTLYSKLKSYELIQNYFYSNQTNVFPLNPTQAKRYRLKLTELHELDKSGNNPKKHFFDYDDTMLPPLGTNGKDFWGYYNGKNSNINLIPLQPFQYFGNNVGAADRNPDANFMKAGILNKVTYPTGGYTEFFYEPHEYETTEATLVPKSKNVFAVGLQNVIGDGTYLEDIVVFTPNYSGYANITIEASDRSSTNGVFPRVTLQRSGATGYLIDHSIDPTTYSYPLNPPTITISFPPVWLDKDVTYTFKAVAEGTSNSMEFDGAAYMKADIDYSEESTSSVPVTKIAGGLRIQQIKSRDSNDNYAFSKQYEYQDEKLITPETFIKEQYLDAPIEVWNACTISGGSVPFCNSASTVRRFYYGGTVQGLTLNSGSPVVYSSVDEFVVDDSNNDLGKTNYSFDVQTDEILATPTSYQGGIMLLKKDWIGGQNTSKTIYAKNETDFISQEINDHVIKRYDESYKMYKIVHSKRISGSCSIIDENGPGERFQVFEYPIFTGVKLQNSSQTTTKYGNEELTTINSIFYENETHLQPTRTEHINSKGEVITTQSIYPDDIANINDLEGPDLSPLEKAAIDRLKKNDLHRLSEPIQTITTVENGNTLLSKTIQRTNYNDWGSNIVLPDSIQTLKGSYSAANEMQDRIVFHDYDNQGNPLEVSKAGGPHSYYVWGYNGEYPIAKIENLESSQISTTLQNLINSAEIASIADTDNCKTPNCKEQLLRVALDALRNSSDLSNSMVTTYTYDPLIGVTSMTDPRGYIMYYEYDDFNRLKAVKDADGNLVTDYQYNFKTQP